MPGGEPATEARAGERRASKDRCHASRPSLQFTTPEREVRTFSIAVSKKDAEGNDVTRWIRCDDWALLSRLVGKGDRVKVKGHFRERTYEKDGETKTVRDFVVEDLKIERHKIRHQAE